MLTAFNPDSSFELSAGTSDFHYCIQGENETHFHTKVCPGGYTAFIYKAWRTLLFRSPSFLLFCSHTRIVVLWRGESLVQPMSTATGIGQHSNISHSLFADCRTEVLSLDLCAVPRLTGHFVLQPCQQPHQESSSWQGIGGDVQQPPHPLSFAESRYQDNWQGNKTL